MKLGRTILQSVLVGGLALCASPAMAATLTFDWTVTSATNPEGDPSGFGNSRSIIVGGIKVTATGWGYTYSASDNAFETAGLGKYGGSGLGICNQSEDPTAPPNCASPNHAIDSNGPDDFVLFMFTDATTGAPVVIDPRSVVLTTFGGGYDTDVSYWLGTVAGPINLNGVTQASLSGLGFGARVDDNTASTGDRTVYIPPPTGVGGTTASAILFGGSVTSADDYFKLKSLTIDTITPPPSVPEPLTLTLVGLGMAGLRQYRRRVTA